MLQINSAKNWAGGEVYVYLLCRELIKRGEQVVLACRPNSAIDIKFRECNMPVINQPIKGAIDWKSAKNLVDYCKENDITLVHAHSGRDYWIALLMKLMNPSLKIVFTRHVLIPLKNTFLHRWLYKKVDKVIAVSKAVRSTLTSFDDNKITIVYNGIDFDKFSSGEHGLLRKELNIAEDKKIVAMIGHVSPHKGIETFMHAVKSVLVHHPDTVFMVIGDDFKNGEYINYLNQIENRVHFLGPRQDIPDLIQDIYVFVLPSWSEPFGLVTIEAMAAGKPVVATNTGGTPEIVVDGETGLLIPPKDEPALTKALIDVLGKPGLAETLGRNGSTRAKELFDLQVMVDNIIKVYKSV